MYFEEVPGALEFLGVYVDCEAAVGDIGGVGDRRRETVLGLDYSGSNRGHQRRGPKQGSDLADQVSGRSASLGD